MPTPARSLSSRLSAVRLLAVASVAAAVAVGCTGQVDPTAYGDVNTDNDGYYGNFMYGCTGVEANDEGEYADWTLENPDFCTCVFEGLKEQVPFSEMQEFEDAQAEAEEGEDIPLPENIDQVRQDCAGEASGQA